MIVKIKGVDESWHLYSDFIRVKFGYDYDRRVYFNDKDGHFYIKDILSPSSDECHTIFDPDIMIMNYIRDYASNSKDTNLFFCNWIEGKYKDGSEIFIVFNTDGYILNDEGKTIEVIR